MSQIDILNKLGMIDPSDPAYVAPKKSGLEQVIEALKKSKPNSPLITHYEKLLKQRKDEHLTS